MLIYNFQKKTIKSSFALILINSTGLEYTSCNFQLIVAVIV